MSAAQSTSAGQDLHVTSALASGWLGPSLFGNQFTTGGQSPPPPPTANSLEFAAIAKNLSGLSCWDSVRVMSISATIMELNHRR